MVGLSRNPGENRLLRMLILADDLSGAADCGVACLDAGLETIVALNHSDQIPAADVLALDADTRSLPPDQAASKVHSILRQYAQDPDLLLFKKIDSTLRGNVGPELAAALGAIRAARPQSECIAIIAPAFPSLERTTRNGTQYVHDQPLHDLDIWRVQGLKDHAHIPDMLESAGLKCALLNLDCIRSRQSRLTDQMKASASTADVLVCDAETDDDLLAVASASMHLESRPLWVGSAGLAYQLPRTAGIARSEMPQHTMPLAFNGPALFVIGSLSRNSLEQVRQLSLLDGIIEIRMNPEILLTGDQHSDWPTFERELESSIRVGKDVVLTTGTDTRIDVAQRPLLATALARMASSVRNQIGALVASGGETARAVFEAFGINRLRLRGELEKGIPISVTEGWDRSLPVITKAGDFGSPDTFIKCLRYLHDEVPRLSISQCTKGIE